MVGLPIHGVRYMLIDMKFHSNRPERPRMPGRRRKITGSTYVHSSSPSCRDGSGSAAAGPSSNVSWQNGTGRQQFSQQDPLDHLNFFSLGSSTTTTSWSRSTVEQEHSRTGVPVPPSSLISSNTFSFDLALSHYIESSDGFMSHSSPESATWQTGEVFTPTSSYMGSQPDDVSPLDGQIGSYGSLNSFASSSPNTMASGFSESFGVMEASPTWGSPISNGRMLDDLSMPNDYFEIVPNSPESLTATGRALSKEPPSEVGYLAEPGWNTFDCYSSAENADWITIDPVQGQISANNDPTRSIEPPQVPWNPEHPQYGEFKVEAGNGAFVPRPGSPLEIFKYRENLFRANTPGRPYFGPEGSFLTRENGNDQTKQLYQHDADLRTCGNESSQDVPEAHEHVFSVVTGADTQENFRGRKRKLTPEEKERTLEVRKDGACWACHLSKTKCSPCSSGSPCEQCTRLVGKRRFCLLPCFNDSIESLHTFLVPDCLVGHFTKVSVEAFISKHAIQWGRHIIPARMSWGCRRLLNVNVVAFSLLGDSSELAYNHQAIFANGRVELVRNKCAPLGINMADIDDMRKEYRCHVEDVVENDLAHYVSIAHDDQNSKFAERLLEAVCLWYREGFGDSEERVLLRQAIQVHVASTILERSLVLDESSLCDVQEHFGHESPADSAPRGAQRQIKLAVFMEQRPRIIRVLQNWGKLMRSAARAEKNWTTAFCVFIVMTLTMDKTIAAAHHFCEGRIKFRGRDAKTERETFENLRRLMETSLFERCKEIFHCRYKTRKGGNERCNPIRDGAAAWRGEKVDGRTARLIDDLQSIVREFVPGKAHREHRVIQTGQVVYTELGRLASAFLSDF